MNQAACSNSDSVYVSIKGIPLVASIMGLDSSYCSNLSPADSIIGNPSGGIFSGKGMTGNVFTPAAAGNGLHQIKYTYTNPNGCLSSTFQYASVSVCTGIIQTTSSVFNITGANPASGHLDLKLESNYAGKANSVIMDVSGRLIYQGLLFIEKGEQQIRLSMQNTESGIYFWQLNNGESMVTYRFSWMK